MSDDASTVQQPAAPEGAAPAAAAILRDPSRAPDPQQPAGDFLQRLPPEAQAFFAGLHDRLAEIEAHFAGVNQGDLGKLVDIAKNYFRSHFS